MLLNHITNSFKLLVYTIYLLAKIKHETKMNVTAGVNEFLDIVLEHASVLIAFMDPQFNYTKFNRAHAEVNNQDASFFPDKNHFELCPNPENEAIFQRVVKIGEPVVVKAKPRGHPEHPECGISYWDWSLIPVKDHSIIGTGLVLTLQNVIEHLKVKQALKESEARWRKKKV